ILSKQNKDEETNKYFQKIIESSRRMQSLINDLLSFSKQSVSPGDFKDVDLNILIREALTELEIEVEKTGAEFQIEKLPVICVVLVLMRKVFYNLINNALKFRKNSISPVIKINAERLKERDNRFPMLLDNYTYYKIAISDNGIGFDPQYTKDIFVVFK